MSTTQAPHAISLLVCLETKAGVHYPFSVHLEDENSRRSVKWQDKERGNGGRAITMWRGLDIGMPRYALLTLSLSVCNSPVPPASIYCNVVIA